MIETAHKPATDYGRPRVHHVRSSLKGCLSPIQDYGRPRVHHVSGSGYSHRIMRQTFTFYSHSKREFNIFITYYLIVDREHTSPSEFPDRRKCLTPPFYERPSGEPEGLFLFLVFCFLFLLTVSVSCFCLQFLVSDWSECCCSAQIRILQI